MTKAEWIAEADEICDEFDNDQYNEELDELREEPLTEESAKQVAEIMREEGLEVTFAELEALRGLQPPPEDQATIQNMLRSLESGAHAAESFADAFEELDASSYERSSDEVTEAVARARGIAQGYGLKVCGAET